MKIVPSLQVHLNLIRHKKTKTNKKKEEKKEQQTRFFFQSDCLTVM